MGARRLIRHEVVGLGTLHPRRGTCVSRGCGALLFTARTLLQPESMSFPMGDGATGGLARVWLAIQAIETVLFAMMLKSGARMRTELYRAVNV